MVEEASFLRISSRMVHGEIRKLSDSQFLWTIPDLSLRYLSSRTGFSFSPNFKYKENTYCLQTKLSKSGSADSRYLMGYRIDTLNFSGFASYSLSIEDGNGDDLGTFYSKDYGKFCFIYADGLSRLSFEDFFQLHLTFDPPPTGHPAVREVVISADGKLISPTDVGTQTWSDLQPASSSSCSAEGVEDILQNFKKLLLRGQASDVTFNVKGTEIKAHKTVLAAQSQVFDKMFANEMLEKTSHTVEITDCEPEDFRALLLYLYTGRVEKPTVESAVELYCLADKYNVDVLGRYCVQFLLNNWSVESFCDVVSLGLRHSETDLLDSASLFLHENMKQIVCSPKWMTFNEEDPYEATKILIKAFSYV